MRRNAVLFTAIFLAMISMSQSQEITDLFSNIQSADITVEGDVANGNLQVDLIFEKQILQTKEIFLDGPGTYVLSWDFSKAEKGNYDVCARLKRGEEETSRLCYNFFYAGQTPVRFDVRDFTADSNGMHLSILSSDPAIVDIYYMLISENKALYVSKDKSVSISSGMRLTLDRSWNQILQNDREYLGRIKIVETGHGTTSALMKSFIAKDDATITETYEDETGASATVMGNSRVPFEGDLKFILSMDGRVLETIEKKTPVLLTGKDETVEISWNTTLDPGLYYLQVILLGNKGDLKDIKESIIEAKAIPRPVNTSEPEKKSPLPAGIAIVSLILAILIRRARLK